MFWSGNLKERDYLEGIGIDKSERNRMDSSG